MQNNIFIKILISIPIILLALYFIPFLGVCLLILRYFICSNKKRISTPIIILSVGILLLIPKLLSIFNIPYLENIVTSNLYNINFIKYSKLLITIGIIFLILTFIFRNLFNQVNNYIINYIRNEEKINREITKENNLKMQEKREKAKNTNYVRCPYCGSDNLLSEKTDKCQFCRRTLVNKNFK